MESRYRRLETFVADLLGQGRVAFLPEEALQATGFSRPVFLKSAQRLQKQGRLCLPRSGYYLIIPPQFRSWGAPPPEWFIDDLMRREGQPYYVGLLKAAELHGASHQAVMEFQIVTPARLPKLHVGRTLITFHYRRSLEKLESAIMPRQTDTGSMRISSPELTAFDLLRYPRATGGLENVFTVLTDFGSKLEGGRLAVLCPLFERTVRQRLGYLLQRAGYPGPAEVLEASLRHERTWQWKELDPTLASDDPDLAPPVTERSSRWRLLVRRPPEADEK